MATEVQPMLETFEFTARDGNVQPGDRFHLDHEGRQTVILVTELCPRGPGGMYIHGLAVNNDGTWCGPWGRIIFYKPITIGVETDASFNQAGGHTKRLEVIPSRLVRVRDGKSEFLIGEPPTHAH